ncbi:hypothetical protein TNCV_3484991 [Trichonephila clavipes]|nr:hypothetical protein TNCV_3484991 [Trichonephila clavipes]
MKSLVYETSVPSVEDLIIRIPATNGRVRDMPGIFKNTAQLLAKKNFHGRGRRVVKEFDCGWPCHEFEPSTTKDPPCRGIMQVKSVKSSNVLPVVW